TSRVCGACSICLALSFAANFSFAIVDLITMVAIGARPCARTQSTRARIRLLGACMLPGLIVTLFVSAPAVLHFPKRELQYGSYSIGEWLGEVVRDSLYQLNPHIVNPMVMRILIWVQPLLIPVLLALALREWIRHRDGRLVSFLLALIAASIAGHWASFKLVHLLLPKERTAIWIVPLLTLVVGAVATGKRALTVALYMMSLNF